VTGISDVTSAVAVNWIKPAGAADFHGAAYDVSTWEDLDGVVSFGGRSFDLGSVSFDGAADTDGSGTVDSRDLLTQLNAAAKSALGLTRGPFLAGSPGSEGSLAFIVQEAVPGYTVDPTNSGTGLAISSSAADRARATPVFTPSSGAAGAIEAVDAAIDTVSRVRADLGAVQNRLEHAGRATGVTLENLTASESRIRDADMAAEMVRFTRNQVLAQAGTAMLAQSGQVAKGVLALLN
jgi:flagellin